MTGEAAFWPNPVYAVVRHLIGEINEE